jgi:hypothetical protein
MTAPAIRGGPFRTGLQTGIAWVRSRASRLPRSARIAVLVGAVALLALAVRSLFAGGVSTPSGIEPVRVRKDDLVMTVEVEGELAAVRAIEIGAPQIRDVWDYKISFLAPESKPVKKGEPVIGFDTQQLQKTLEEKSAEFAEASKQIERKQIDLDIKIRALQLELDEAEATLRKSQLKSDVPDDLKGRIEAMQARIDLEDAEGTVANLNSKIAATRAMGEAEIESLESRRDRAKGRVEDLQAAIERLMIKAPQDGIVIYKTNWQEQKKKVGDSTWVGEKVLELPDLVEMKANGQVDEADAGQVAVGQKVTLRLEARSDLDVTGTVRSIGRTVLRKSWRIPNKIYKIDIALTKTDSEVMRPAMRFRGEIETQRFASLLVAPREAVFLRTTGPVVWVKRGGSYVETPLEAGRRNARFVEIVSGLAEGDVLSPVDLRPPESAKPAGPVGPMTAGL